MILVVARPERPVVSLTSNRKYPPEATLLVEASGDRKERASFATSVVVMLTQRPDIWLWFGWQCSDCFTGAKSF